MPQQTYRSFVPDVLELIPPCKQSGRDKTTPLVLDSPHSGSIYPDDFNYAIDLTLLRRLEDAWVDELFDTAPQHGAHFLRALFPRGYIDPNRHEADIDSEMLTEPWPGTIRPSDKVRWGKGLFFRQVANRHVYNRGLNIAEVEHRLHKYYWPYHQHLQNILDHLWQAHGCVYHLNCHSMPGVSPANSPEGSGVARADFVLGDLDGSSCGKDFTFIVHDYLTDAGFEVKINDPYKGVELVRRYSNPGQRRHSLQIEINRGLYMTQGSLQKTAHFAALKEVLDGLMSELGDFVLEQTQP